MKAITANRLTDGEVVFWNEGRWVERFADAQIFQPDDDAHAEAAASLSGPALLIVGEAMALARSSEEGAGEGRVQVETLIRGARA